MKIPSEVIVKMVRTYRDSPQNSSDAMQAAADVLVPYVLAEAQRVVSSADKAEAERNEFERKGQGLCSAYGNALINIHGWEAEVKRLKAQIAAYEMPVSDTQYPPSDAHLAWEYRGEGLYLTWLNPFNANRKEDVAMFMWPSHAPEVTSEVERLYEAMAASFVEAWKLSRKLPPPAITDADAKQQAIKDRQQDAKEGL